MRQETVVITGAAGFIGSHLTDRLLEQGCRVVGIDNLILGRTANLEAALQNPKFTFIQKDLNDLKGCTHAVSEALGSVSPGTHIDAVWHLAANSDIPAGVKDWSVDLNNTFLTTYHTLQMAKAWGVPKFLFASSSAIYGEHPQELTEELGPLFPISNYGAMKLASEGVITAGVESFLKQCWIFRFPNVVGARSTHGVIHDLVLKLKKTPNRLEVLGDGTQQKPYLHVLELIDAMEYCYQHSQDRINYFNIANADRGATVKMIAESVVAAVSPRAALNYGVGGKGWVGDVSKFSYSTRKINALGWKPKLNSEAVIRKAVGEIAGELLQGA